MQQNTTQCIWQSIIDLCPNNVWVWLRTISRVADCSIASVLLIVWCISLALICFGAATGCLNYKCWQSGSGCCCLWKPCLSVIKATCCRRLTSRQRRINPWTGMHYTLTALSVQTRTLVWRHRIQCFLKKKNVICKRRWNQYNSRRLVIFHCCQRRGYHRIYQQPR